MFKLSIDKKILAISCLKGGNSGYIMNIIIDPKDNYFLALLYSFYDMAVNIYNKKRFDTDMTVISKYSIACNEVK